MRMSDAQFNALKTLLAVTMTLSQIKESSSILDVIIICLEWILVCWKCTLSNDHELLLLLLARPPPKTSPQLLHVQLA